MPVSTEKFHHLVEYLDSLVPSSPPTLARLVVEHDALLALLMWTSVRGKKCGGWDPVRFLPIRWPDSQVAFA